MEWPSTRSPHVELLYFLRQRVCRIVCLCVLLRISLLSLLGLRTCGGRSLVLIVILPTVLDLSCDLLRLLLVPLFLPLRILLRALAQRLIRLSRRRGRQPAEDVALRQSSPVHLLLPRAAEARDIFLWGIAWSDLDLLADAERRRIRGSEDVLGSGIVT